ncbi:MAG: hypothetical protein ACRCXZ_08410 [Patescibacteria group bacterium]
MLNTLKSTFWHYLGGGFLSWIIPLVVSLFIYKPETKEWTLGQPTSKLLLIGVLFVTTLILYLYFRKSKDVNWVIIPFVYLMINSFLDTTLLVSFWKSMDLWTWVLTVLPFYIIVFFGLAYFLLRKKPQEPNTKSETPTNEATKAPLEETKTTQLP